MINKNNPECRTSKKLAFGIPIVREKATVLITVLWVITILAALCISVAHRSAIILKLSAYQIDKTKSYAIARAGIYRALAVKKLKYDKKQADTIDALSEKWANDPEVFKNHSFEGGFYTLSYPGHDKETGFLYGLSDESSRLDINKASVSMLGRLISSCGVEEDEAEKIAYCIVDWRDEDSVIGTDLATGRLIGAEDEYYKDLPNPYPCKNGEFEAIEELLLVKGVTPKIFYNFKNLVTLYTKGAVNINTAPMQVLSAIFGIDFDGLAEKINIYRRGRDGKTGTRDDRWFSIGTYVIERGEEGLVEVKNLNDGDWLGNIYGITNQEYSKIRQLIQSQGVKVVASSGIYRAIAKGEFKKVICNVEAVYEFALNKETPVVKFYNAE